MGSLPRFLIATPILFALVTGCPAEVEGPQAQLPSPAAGEALPVSPGLVCRDQLETEIVVVGEGFSPLPIDIPADPRTALPSITLSRSSTLDGAEAPPASFVYPGDPREPNAELLSWESQNQMALVLNQTLVLEDGSTGVLETGIFDLTVRNPNQNEGQSTGALAVAPRPTLTAAAPALLCLEQGPRTLTLSGTTFLRDGAGLPTLAANGESFDQVILSECADIAHAGLSAETCATATYTLPESALPEGTHDLVLENPPAAACHSEEIVTLRVVPPPVISQVEPTLVCTTDGTRDVIVRGSDFLTVDGVLPTATLGGTIVAVTAATDCAPLTTTGLTVQRCDTLALTLPQASVSTPQEPELTITNPDPAGCSGSATALLGLMPPPVITDVQPPALCDDGSDAVLTFTGTDFTVLGTTVPTVFVDGLPAPTVVASDCSAQTVAGQAVELCTTLTVTFPTTGLAGPEVAVAVENPAPIGCISTWAQPLPLMIPPQISTAVPALACTDDADQSVTITGSEFLVIGGVEPAVTLGGTAVTSSVTASSCSPVMVGPVAAESCTEIVALAPQGTLVEGDVEVTVTNPAPLTCGGTSTTVLDAPPTLTITSVSPGGMCAASPPTQVTVAGTGFLDVDGTLPSVVFGGLSLPVDSLGTCQDLTVAGQLVRSCDQLLVTLPTGAFPAGDVPVQVTNPGVAACGVSATGVFTSSAVPTLTGVAPTEFCDELGGVLDLTGTNFTATTSVTLTDAAGNVLSADSVTFIDPTQIQATFGMGLPQGTYDLTASNGPSCEATLPAAVSIEPRPFVFFIDPPVAYNGVAIQATIYSDGLTAAASSVRLLGPNGEIETLVGSSVAGRPNQIFVTIPAGLSPGDWDVEVTSPTGCVGTLVGGLLITDNTSLALASIDPPFGSTNLQTAVVVTAQADPLPAGDVDFISTPRAYLNPNPAGAGTTAASLRAVVYVDNKTLTAVVPPGLAAGNYDLIVVNPDATVGIVSLAFTVTPTDPPVITAVVPGSIDANATSAFEVQGRAFDDLGGVTIDLTCRDPAGTLYTGTAVSLGTTPSAASASVDVSSITDGTGGSVSAGAVCLVRLTNADGSYFDYSAISIKTPAQNLFDWTPTTPMIEARRGLGLQAGRPTATSRYIYAVGGDDGVLGGAKSSIEGVNVGTFGQLSTWEPQRNSLAAAGVAAPRTLGGHVKIGRFLYLVGGHDGSGAMDTVLRSQILDPLATPEVIDLSLVLGEGTGLAAGFWSYRIAATFPATDTANPGGESLPGEVLGVQVPSIIGVELSLTWDAIPGADGYRIYRTPGPDQSVDTVELLATVTGGASSYVDAGTVATTPGEVPLPPGSLGRWHDAGMSLATPRHRLAVAAGPDPSSPGIEYLYAFGGDDGAGNALATIEYFTVAVTAPVLPKDTEHHQLTATGLTTATLPAARESHGAFVVTNDDFTVVPVSSTWIYVGPGETGAGGAVSDVDAAEIPTGGDILAFHNLASPNGRERSGAADGNGFLFLIGGAGALSGGVSAQLCATGDPGCAGGPPEPPDLQNWNGLGVSMTEGREDFGITQESAFFFVGGGHNGTTVTNSVDQTVK